jgi:DNA-binding GntR family transcriptional regulator
MANATERAYQQIKSAILRGHLAPGSQVKEEEVAALCGVSRTPVRDALRRLEAEMFIERSESQRSFVSDWSNTDLGELFTLRAMLESYAAQRAAHNMTPMVLAQLKRANQRIASLIESPQLDVDAFLRENGIFHRLIIEAAASERLAAMISRLVLVPVLHRTAHRYTAAELRRSLAEHEEIIAAFEVSDAEWAGAVMTGHIRRAFHTLSMAREAAHAA